MEESGMVEVLNDGKRPARIIDIIVRRLREFFIRINTYLNTHLEDTWCPREIREIKCRSKKLRL